MPSSTLGLLAPLLLGASRWIIRNDQAAAYHLDDNNPQQNHKYTPPVPYNNNNSNISAANVTTCLESKCPAQAKACAADDTCKAGFRCATACKGPTAALCLSKCITTHLDAAMISAGECAEESGCIPKGAAGRQTAFASGANVTTCLESKCPAQAKACAAYDTCKAGFRCATACKGPTAALCLSKCITTHLDAAMISAGECAEKSGCIPKGVADF